MTTIVELFTTRTVGGIDCTVHRDIPRPLPTHIITSSPHSTYPTMSDVTDPKVAAELKKKRTFRTFSYRGIELEKLLDLGNEEVGTLYLIPILTDPAIFAARRCVYRLTPPTC